MGICNTIHFFKAHGVNFWRSKFLCSGSHIGWFSRWPPKPLLTISLDLIGLEGWFLGQNIFFHTCKIH